MQAPTWRPIHSTRFKTFYNNHHLEVYKNSNGRWRVTVDDRLYGDEFGDELYAKVFAEKSARNWSPDYRN